MPFERALRYQFEDKQWVTKLGLGALILLVPILNLAILGYAVGIIRNVASRSPEPLPNWDGLGEKLRDGLILTAAAFLYVIPVLILVWLLFGVLAAAGVISRSSSHGALLVSLMLSVLLYLAAFMLIRPAIMIVFSRDRTFASCFGLRDVAHVFKLQRWFVSPTGLVLILAGLAIALILGFISLVFGRIPYLGWAVGIVLAVGTLIYSMTVDAYLIGQFRIAVLGWER